MRWMVGQTGVINSRNRRVLLKEGSKSQCALALVAHANRQCLNTSMQQETRMWVERTAEVVKLMLDPLLV